MAILLGARPGGRGGFAVSALFWTGRLPARLIHSRSVSGVQAVLEEIMGVVGEWGELTVAAIDAPLTWSGSENGERAVDVALRKLAPSWAPRGWFRAPNALPGAVAIQGPALAWALAVEAKRGLLPEHRIVETHPRASLARTLRDLRQPVLDYRDKKVSEERRRQALEQIVTRFVDAGVIAKEVEGPHSPEELEGLVCAIVALAVGVESTGLVSRELEGAEIRPVGTRPVVLLEALP